mgnify:CR=1 FL=1
MAEAEINHLARLISEDNRKAFNMLFEVYYDEVFRFAYYFLKDKEARRDVVLDVFFSIWQSRKKLREITNMEAYLYIVTKNTAAHYLSKNKGRNTVSLDEIPVQIEDSGDLSPVDKMTNQEIEALLTKVIDELPERCRTIFLLARQQGMKTKEISDVLSISESTVRVQMKVAIEKIIAKLRPYFPDLTLTLLFTLFFGK